MERKKRGNGAVTAQGVLLSHLGHDETAKATHGLRDLDQADAAPAHFAHVQLRTCNKTSASAIS
jgi:hypothetical protein